VIYFKSHAEQGGPFLPSKAIFAVDARMICNLVASYIDNFNFTEALNHSTQNLHANTTTGRIELIQRLGASTLGGPA